MCKNQSDLDGWDNCYTKCYSRVGGCNNPRNLCKCSDCGCIQTYEVRKHELDRIQQFEDEARDDSHFRQKILTRAMRCSDGKRQRFIQFLKEIGRQDLAGFIEMTMVK